MLLAYLYFAPNNDPPKKETKADNKEKKTSATNNNNTKPTEAIHNTNTGTSGSYSENKPKKGLVPI